MLDFQEANPWLSGAQAGQGLVGNQLDILKQAIANKYLPQTLKAEINSKNAFANIVGPQAAAKAAANPQIMVNLSPEQQAALLKRSAQLGNSYNSQQQSASNGNIPTDVMNQAINNRMQPQQGSNQSQSYNNNNQVDNSLLSSKLQNQSPDMNQNPQQSNQDPNANSYTQNIANYKSKTSESEASGKIRANQIGELDKQVLNAEGKQSTFNYLGGILSSPEIEQIRKNPLLGHYEMSYYAKEGTPAQQDLIGKYYTTAGDIIKDAAQDFKGQFRSGEQALLYQMKPSPSDTVDVARGKLQALMYFNKVLHDRSRMTSKLMRTNGTIDQDDALQLADRNINGDAIRLKLGDMVYPPVSIRNSKTGEKVTVPRSVATKQYGINFE